MKSEDILQSDLLDLIFDKRNKQYGAYELRKHYRRRLVKALVIAFIFAGGVAALSSFAKEDMLVTAIFNMPEPEPTSLPPVEPEKKKPEMPKQVQQPKKDIAQKPLAQQKYTKNIDIVKNPLDADKVNTIKDDVAFGGKDIEGPVSHVIVPAPTKIDAGGNDLPAGPAVDKSTPLHTADIMPAYPGGIKELRKFLEKNLRSFDDIEAGRVVSVKITFVVGYDGKLKGFQVLEDGGDAYNREVIRVLKKMPEWIPGKANGENVSVYYTIPVKFTAAE